MNEDMEEVEGTSGGNGSKLAIAAAGDQNSRSGSQTAGQNQLAHQRSREARVSRGVPRGVSFRCLIPGAEQDQNRFLSAR